ncbi:MAG: phosphoribosylformylglycinamidine synthase subunit PurS [Dehalococcoidia bacterium]|nr:phosphoribosylformylglycinamidine synthase [Chloroflexota bacterium]MCH2525840.1 phosphoribosylformylglycinamidine synthase subunit PurS [Dehalococcoidia bacterium]MQF99937.1 phosphoribosylformylglycinamidine synthase subunit PurS [SAR202 cluster bacterium]|tara:strand:+ start:1094 stop:1351 length:258 start_codon:yes stop_codon:yes gene_type:complete
MSNIFLANIRVVLKETVSDPQGATIMAGLKTLGFDSVQDLRAGKFLQVRITANDPQSAREQVAQMCDKLLANPVIEEYDFDIEDS